MLEERTKEVTEKLDTVRKISMIGGLFSDIVYFNKKLEKTQPTQSVYLLARLSQYLRETADLIDSVLGDVLEDNRVPIDTSTLSMEEAVDQLIADTLSLSDDGGST